MKFSILQRITSSSRGALPVLPCFSSSTSLIILAIVTLSQLTLSTNAQRLDSGSSNSTGDDILDSLGPLWIPRSFELVCCLGGFPSADDPQNVRNLTHEVVGFVEEARVGSSCARYRGKYVLSATSLFNFNGLSPIGVSCKCPEVSGKQQLDKNCRVLPACKNGGYRSFSNSLRCACPDPNFGDACEKFCEQGQLLKGADGRSYCSCVPFYQGEECRDMVCLNGGTEMKGRCICPPNFLGYHCEIDTNRTNAGRFHRYGEQGGDLFSRDISGTIFSLIMIIVLVVSMYLLMKHRMQVQSRLNLRRDERRCRDEMLHDDLHVIPFRSAMLGEAANGGPPPYLTHELGRARRGDALPPLPSYEDATKMPPLSIHGGAATATRSTSSRSSDSEQQQVNEASVSDVVPVEHSDPPSSSNRTPDFDQTPVFSVVRPKLERSVSTRSI